MIFAIVDHWALQIPIIISTLTIIRIHFFVFVVIGCVLLIGDGVGVGVGVGNGVGITSIGNVVGVESSTFSIEIDGICMRVFLYVKKISPFVGNAVALITSPLTRLTCSLLVQLLVVFGGIGGPYSIQTSVE